MLKICKVCNQEKDIESFYKRSDNLDGRSGTCKRCKSDKDRVSRKLKIENRKIQNIRNKTCKTCKKSMLIDKFSKDKYTNDGLSTRCIKCHKENYIINKDKINQCGKKYYQNNKEKIKEKHKAYKILHSSKIKSREKRLSNYKDNINYRLKHQYRSRIKNFIKGKNKSVKSLELLGCNIDFFKLYIESKFTKGMTWDTGGVYGWHLDHIIPISSFDLSDPEQQKLCFHYTNYQPLWATTQIAISYGEDSSYIGNLEKSDKLIRYVDIY